MTVLFSHRIFRMLLPLALGALGGLSYWYLVGCANGACPLTSRWWTSTLYGALVGATFLLPGKRVMAERPRSNNHHHPS